MVQANPLVSDFTILGSYGELHQVTDLASPAAVNAVQELEVASASGGTFTVTAMGETTAPIAYNASAATVQTAMRALTAFDGSDITAAGGALNTAPVTLTMAGQYAGRKVNDFHVDGSGLTGVGAAVTVNTTQAGSPAGTTEWLANVHQVDAKITVNKLEVKRSGTRRTGYKRGEIAGDGTITGYKVTSRFVAAIAGEMADETNPPAPLVLDVALADPEALGVERLRLHHVKLWELPFGWSVGDLIEEALPFTFEDIEILEEITGVMV